MNKDNKSTEDGSMDEKLHISDVSSSFFCSEWEWNEGRPKCDKQCKDCKKTQKKNES
jgi:hypothetical protein